MIDQDKRKAIYLLHAEGMEIRDISRQLRVNRNTVRDIIEQGGLSPETIRADKIRIDPVLLIGLYGECRGRIQRIYEKLTEEQGITIGYSTLSRMIRELELGETKKSRCGKVPDEPDEMQHDTSPYTLSIGNRETRVVGSIIYFRYSKMRYLTFYRSFNRFNMKCFLHEALTFFGYSDK